MIVVQEEAGKVVVARQACIETGEEMREVEEERHGRMRERETARQVQCSAHAREV